MGLPITSWVEFYIILISFVIIFAGKIRRNGNNWIIASIISISIFVLSIITPKDIEEGHTIFSSDAESLHKTNLPENVYQLALFFSKNDQLGVPKPRKAWAFSADSVWNKSYLSRKTNQLDFKNPYYSRIGVYNDLEAGADHYSFKIRYPLIVRYDLPERFNNADICFSGMVFINEVKYFHEDKRCIKLPNQKTILYGFDMGNLPILGISIDSNDITSLWINILKYLKIVSAFTILILLGKVHRSFIIITFVGTISMFIFLADYTLQNGLRSAFSTFVYMSRGNDGLVHFGYGRQILENFIEGNYLLAFRGGRDIFYYMPGARYAHAIWMLVFGDSFLGYILLGSMLPIVIYNLSLRFVSNKSAFLLVLIYLFFPIFESFGFLHFYYMKLIIKGHGGVISWVSLFSSIILLLPTKGSSFNPNTSRWLLAGTLLAIACSCRPNILPICGMLVFGFGILSIHKKKYFPFFSLCFGMSQIFLLTLHNWFFGNQIHLITKSAISNMYVSYEMWLKALIKLANGIYDKNLWNVILENLFVWIHPTELWLITALAFLIWSIFSKKIKIEIRLLSLAVLFGHLVFLFYRGDPRYAYGIWLLSLMIFFNAVPFFIKKRPAIYEKILSKLPTNIYLNGK